MKAASSGFFDVDAIIYGRGYHGYFSNSLYLQEDGFSNEIGLVSHAYLFDRFLTRMGYKEVRLIIPHTYLGLFTLYTTHKSVKEVVYVEEGEAAYQNNLQYIKIQKSDSATFNSGVIDIVRQLGFDIAGVNLSQGEFYTDCYGKYVGVLACSDMAFRNFPGTKWRVNLQKVNYFDEDVIIILCTNIYDFYPILNKRISENKIKVNGHEILNSLFVAQIKLIKKILEKSPGDKYRKIIKRHPAISSYAFKNFMSHFPSVESWDDSKIGYETSGVEVGCLNFSKLYSIGVSSAARYARMLNQSVEIEVTEISDFEVIDLAYDLYISPCETHFMSEPIADPKLIL